MVIPILDVAPRVDFAGLEVFQAIVQVAVDIAIEGIETVLDLAVRALGVLTGLRVGVVEIRPD